MSLIRLVLLTLTVIASCNASGIGFIKTVPIVRYAPFYNFPTGARSIHAVAPVAVGHALPPPPALVPAPPPAIAPAPVFPAPGYPVPVLPAPAYAPAPAPVFAAPAFPAPAVHAPVFAPAPAFPAPAYVPAPPPLFTPTVPRVASPLPAPTVFARAFPALPAVPFSPIVRPVAPAIAPVFAPASGFAPPLPITRFFPSLHLFNKVVSTAPAPYLPATPLVKQFAWK